MLISLILTASVGITSAQQPFVDCGKFVFGIFTDISTMDPAIAYIWYDMMSVRNAYETLVQYNLKDFSIEPLLAESWELDADGGIFRLRKGVKFQDGTDFNAEAVRFTWQRIMAINKAPAPWIKSIKDIKVVDNHTIRIDTTKNWAFLLDALAAQQIFLVISPTAVKKNATKEDPWAEKWFHNRTCGTGPYTVTEWLPNQYITMVRNKDYWKGWSGRHFSETVYKIIPEVNTQKMMIKRGELDLINHLPAEHWDVLKADPNLTVKVFPSKTEQFFMMNNVRGPLADKNMRLAVTYALDYDACREAFQAPEGGMIVGPVYKQDLKKAMEFKNKSAYAGKEVELSLGYTATIDIHKRLMVVMESSLKKIGVKCKLRGMTWPTMAKEIYGPREEAGDLFPYYAVSIFDDPYGMLYKVLHSDNNKLGGANLGYSNSKFDALLNQAAVTIDRKKRYALYEEAKKIAVDDAAMIWVFMLPFHLIHRNNIKVYPHTQIGDALGQIIYYYDIYRE